MRLKTLLVFAYVLYAGMASSQNCKYIVNEQDPLTDDIIRTVKTRLTSPTPYYFFTYIRNGSDYKFRVEVGDYGELDNSIEEGSELILRAGNGEVFRMKAIGTAKPEVVDDYGSKITKYDITYQMEESHMLAIAESGIVFIRIADLKNTFSDQEIPTAVVEISRDNAQCIFK